MTTTLRMLCAAMTATLLHIHVAHAAMSDNVIRIGILNDRSGAYADLGGEGSVVAAKMAAEELGNAIGAVPIEIVSADHQNKPDIGLGIVRRWLDTEKVDAVADISNSGVGFAVTALAKERNKIVLNASASSDFTGKVPKMTMNLKLQGVQAEPLLNDLTGKAKARGTANFSGALIAAGASAPALKRTLNGQMNFSIKDGALKGYNLGKIMRQGKRKPTTSKSKISARPSACSATRPGGTRCSSTGN